MAELKTKENDANVTAFLEKSPNVEDAKRLSALFKKVTGKKPAMWGTSIVGFDKYHYKSSRSSQEGDWPMIAFSPRKANLTIYLMDGTKKHSALLKKLGKHKASGGSCLYIKKLIDIDMKVLEEIVSKGYANMKEKYN